MKKIHKLTQLYDNKTPVRVIMLCKASQTGSNSEPKTFNSSFVTCPRCLAFLENDFESRYANEGWKK